MSGSVFNFPNSPAVGDVIWMPDGTSRIWDGVKWKSSAAGPAFSGYLPTSGGTLTGPLILYADPAADLEAATKHYVDTVTIDGGIF